MSENLKFPEKRRVYHGHEAVSGSRRPISVRSLAALAMALAVVASAEAQRSAPWVGQSFSGVPCSGNRQGVGPLDYTSRSDRNSNLFDLIVEAHFYPEVEALTGRNTFGDLDYTLRAIPNHHRALDAMMRYQLGSDNEHRQYLLKRKIPPTECYLYRAQNFAPNDGKIDLLLGLLKHRLGDMEGALAVYKQAESKGATSSELYYNIGLLLIDMDRPKEAMRYARRAYSSGFPLRGLARKLEARGMAIDF